MCAMGNKRSSESLGNEVEENLSDREIDGSAAKKKMRNENKNDASSNIKPMERKKRRKAMDKERHLASSENEEIKSKPKEVPASALNSNMADGGLPKFHIDVFRDLASADESLRFGAAEKLVTELRAVQEAYEGVEDKSSLDSSLKLEASKDDGLDGCAPSLRYAVKRLIRGTSSSRECARQGFTLGLSLLLNIIPTLKLEPLMKLVLDMLEVSSSMNGQEARDCLLGRLFVYGAISRSRRLLREWESDPCTPCISDLTSSIISLASKKRYLQEPAVAIMVDMLEQLPNEAIEGHLLKAPGLEDWFQSSTEIGNPDSLLLALKVREKTRSSDMDFGKLLPIPFSASSLFSSDHLTSLSNCLKESSFCQPRVHSVWPVLVHLLLPDTIVLSEDSSLLNSGKKSKRSRRVHSSGEETARCVENFCEAVLEGALLSSSHDRKHLAFDVVLLLLPRLPASFVPIVFSYKLVHCLMDILSSKESWLHKVAQRFLKELQRWVENDDSRRISVILALQKHSNGKFDSVTRTRTTKAMAESFTSESGCLLFIESMTDAFIDDGAASDEPSDQSQTTDDTSEIGSVDGKDTSGVPRSSDSLRIWIAEALPSALKNAKLEHDARFRVQKEILKFLTVQGLFSSSLGTEVTSFDLQEKFTWPKVAVSLAIRKLCVEQIQSLLSSVQKLEGSHPRGGGPEPYDLGSYFMCFLSTIRSIPSVSLFRSLSEEDEGAFEKLLDMEAKLSREERNCEFDTVSYKLHSARHLLIQLLLQLLLRPGEVSDVASELVICCGKAFAVSGDEEDEYGDASPELMDVLVDTLLSLLPQSSSAMRVAVEQVFKSFCEDITDDGLRRMLKIVKKDLKPARHQAESSDDEGDDDEEDLLIEEEIDEGESGEAFTSEDAADPPPADVNSDESNDSDSGLDDDEMFRMDAHLANILKEKVNQSGGESAQFQLVLFKLRVLSLLEIYLHEIPGKPQVLTIYSSLAHAFVNPNAAEGGDQLVQRIWGILQKKIFKARESPKAESHLLPLLESLLAKNLKLASKSVKKKSKHANPSQRKLSLLRQRQKMVSAFARDSTYWILKIIDSGGFSDSDLRGVFDTFEGVLGAYFNSKKSQVRCDFLREIFRRRPWIGRHLFWSLLERICSTKSEFRRVESLELVTEILRSEENGGKLLKRNVKSVLCLVKTLVTKTPEKQSRRADVRRFCVKLFQIVASHDMMKSLIKEMEPEVVSACESQLGDAFANFLRD